MKNMKKLTAFVSALALAVCAVPMATSAGTTEYILTDGTVVHSGAEFEAYKEAYLNDTSSDLGDVNRDGCINEVDANMIAQYYAKLATDNYDYYTEEEHEIFRKYGDVFNDGYINAFDASWVLAKSYANAEKVSSSKFNLYYKLMILYEEKDAYNDYINADLTPPALFGDVNHDGLIDIKDAAMIDMYYIDASTDNADRYTEEQKENFLFYGDFTQDGAVNSADVSCILTKYAREQLDGIGDLNQDGIIDISDIEIMREYISNDEDNTAEEVEIINNYGDMDGDGVSATTMDLALLANLVVGNPEENTEMGDVNHDGFVNAIDASIIACYYAACSCNMYDLYAEAEHENFQTYGDLNNDGRVNSADSSLILKIYAENSTL